MTWPGLLCWPVFVLHEPVHKLCVKYLFPYIYSSPNAWWLNMCLYPFALVLISLLASYLIDQPWARQLHRWRKGNENAPQRTAPQVNPAEKDFSYERVEGYRNNRNMGMRG